MKATAIRQLYREKDHFQDQLVTVQGWIRTVRDSKNFGFIELNDGSFFKNLQVVVNDQLENFKQAVKLPIASAIQVTGRIVVTENARQPFELQANKIDLLASSSSDFPLQKKRHSFEYLRTIAHLRPRSNAFSAVFRVRSLASYAIHEFFRQQEFVYVHTPILTQSDAEGAGEMFSVTTLDLQNPPKDASGQLDYSQDFFGKPTKLTVTGQLQGEIFALAFSKIYTFGPTFRAEKSYTHRHAAEFWMIEPEVAFADIHDNMDLAEAMMKYIIRYILEHAPEEMEFFNSLIDPGLLERLQNVLDHDFERITYSQAIEILAKSGQKFEYAPIWGQELQTEHERYLTEEIYKKPVFVIDYPKDVKAFYMKLNPDQQTVAAMDLLVPGIGEIIGGSQREESVELLEQRLAQLGLDAQDYWWYLDIRKYGGVKHSGYGLGFERLVMYLTGMHNIRDVIPFPRTAGSAEF